MRAMVAGALRAVSWAAIIVAFLFAAGALTAEEWADSIWARPLPKRKTLP